MLGSSRPPARGKLERSRVYLYSISSLLCPPPPNEETKSDIYAPIRDLALRALHQPLVHLTLQVSLDLHPPPLQRGFTSAATSTLGSDDLYRSHALDGLPHPHLCPTASDQTLADTQIGTPGGDVQWRVSRVVRRTNERQGSDERDVAQEIRIGLSMKRGRVHDPVVERESVGQVGRRRRRRRRIERWKRKEAVRHGGHTEEDI